MAAKEKPLILIVDDTPINVQVLAEAFRTDYRVRAVTSGQAALDSIAKHGIPDLLLLDIMMPEMDGYEVCRQLKNNQMTQDIPIIFVTAKSDAMDEEYGLRLGAMDYITKPFYLPIVTARVQNQINLKLKNDLLESLVMLDGLTNLPNRRRFDEALELEWKRAYRNLLPLTLVMADIDFFKGYNDNLGHRAGDACLKKVAQALAETIQRPADLVARYGGEEFVILLPETNSAGAQIIVERFCAGVESLQIPHPASKVSPWVTISVGFASIMPGSKAELASTSLLERADKMLYRAKEEGRNRVCGEGP
ncbi:two-component system, chemotaxis family, response regulator WspR [Gammaproteobacteria bacterium]